MFSNYKNIKKLFKESVRKYPEKIFLEHPVNNKKKIINYTYHEANVLVNKYKNFFKNIGLITNDRVAVMIGNVPEYFLLKLSLNVLGISSVPLNIELSVKELEYIVSHSKPKLIITIKKHSKKLEELFSVTKYKIGICSFNNLKLEWIKLIKPRSNSKFKSIRLKPTTEASLLYTSGTTGSPKGCILSHEYEISAGFSYFQKKGLISIKKKKEKIYNCLPVHHVNSSVLSFYAILLSGNCQIQAERFSSTLFWQHIKINRATIFHYLGVMVPILLKQNMNKYEKDNCLRLGVGAGIEPGLHKKFEERFCIPMVEIWGMTEMVRCISDNGKKRKIGQRCFGKADNSLETKVTDDKGKSIYNKPGDFYIRYSKEDPKKGFFSGYLNDKKSTNSSWETGWFKTGDVVIKDRNAKLYFIDRKKNIIRRGGENISSAEIEDNLISLPSILNCAVIPIPHDIYGEEILAFIILKNTKNINFNIVYDIMLSLRKKLAYFKLPFYVQFVSNIPTTSTEKVKKSELLKKFNKKDKKFFFDVSHLKKKLK